MAVALWLMWQYLGGRWRPSRTAQARRRYDAGVAASLEITDAQTRLQRARDNQVNALYNYNVARLDLATATGTIGDYVNQ